MAWPVIAVLVVAFSAHAAPRLTGLDPLGFILGNGEHAEIDTASATSLKALEVATFLWTLSHPDAESTAGVAWVP